MDFGYPQFTEAKILSEFIKTDAHKMEVTSRPRSTLDTNKQLIPGMAQVAMKPPMAVTNAVSWRSEGIKHKKNEVFLDVVESVNLLVNSNGTVVLSEVVGCLKMRTFLSGMPECKLGLNDKVRHGLTSVRAVWVAEDQPHLQVVEAVALQLRRRTASPVCPFAVLLLCKAAHQIADLWFSPAATSRFEFSTGEETAMGQGCL
jgi:Adaptor complexes medium subunit family